MPLYLVGLGLGSKGYLTLKALEVMKNSDKIYLDSYTSFIDQDLLDELRKNFKGKLVDADRRVLEEGSSSIVEEAEKLNVCILVPGDPLIATTHLSIIFEAAKKGVKSEIIYGVSAYSALISASCLQAYKFGKTVTIPKSGVGIESCYLSILENMERGLHTLVLLDTADEGLEIPAALKMLSRVEEKLGMGLISERRLLVCLARIGFSDEFRWAGSLVQALRANYPPPPHSIVFPGSLHFSEAEALKEILRADPEIVDSHLPLRHSWSRISKYISSVESVLKTLMISGDSSELREALSLAKSYLEDSQRFRSEGRIFDALAAISYAEGLLDGLRLLGKVRFSWKRQGQP
ncbi:MAG: diphthine synthase [Thaumarchaeota archaeon]|nr:diphthine synthase [Nitrososphaerota archaeon]